MVETSLAWWPFFVRTSFVLTKLEKVTGAVEGLHQKDHETISESRSVVSDSLQPHRLYTPRNSLGQNTAVSSLFLLQEIFPTQGSSPSLLHCKQILYQLSHQRSPWDHQVPYKCFPLGGKTTANLSRILLLKVRDFFFFVFATFQWGGGMIFINESTWLTKPVIDLPFPLFTKGLSPGTPFHRPNLKSRTQYCKHFWHSSKIRFDGTVFPHTNSQNLLGFQWFSGDLWDMNLKIFSISKDHRSAHMYLRFWKFETSFLDNLIKRGRTNLTEEDGTNSGCCVTAEAMFALWNDSAPQQTHLGTPPHSERKLRAKRHATELYFKGKRKKTQQAEDRSDL